LIFSYLIYCLETESRKTLLEIVQWRRVRWSGVTVVEAWEQFWNPKEGGMSAVVKL
jgi:hypothetical protein